MANCLLAIESTCDETAAAVVTDDGRVLGECIATQTELHEQFQGVVPEIAARAHLERILPVIDTAMMNNHHRATESGDNSICGLDISAHVLIVAFAAS